MPEGHKQAFFKKFVLIAAITAMSGFFAFSSPVNAAAGINKQINFQGKVVLTTSGTNVADASYSFLFCIYTTASPATPCTAGADNDAVWRESKSLTVTDGIFQTNLGDTTALPGSVDFNTDNIYLGINFDGNGQMTPLVRFTATPYAMNADKIHGLSVTDTTGTLTIPNGKTISFGDAFATSGAFATTLTSTGITNVTLPTTGTLSTLAGAEAFTNKTSYNGLVVTANTGVITTGTWNGTDIAVADGGTGTSNGSITGTGALVFTPAAGQGMTLGTTGAGNTTSITLATDSTGDGEVVLPGQSVSASEMVNDTITSTQLNSTLAFSALDYVDLGLIVHNTTAAQGLRLPNAASATPSNPVSGEGYLAWDANGNQLITYNGSAWTTVGGGGGDMVLASVQSVTGAKTFDKDKLLMKGTSTGVTTISTANTSASDYTATLQAATGTLAYQGDTTYIGTTAITLNRGSGALALTGITSIDGSAATVTGAAQTAITSVGTLTGLTVSGAIAANGGITFDASTDTIGAFTAGGTIDMGAQALTGTTGIINYTGFDVDASGNLDALGTLTAGSGNVQVTDAAGKVQHDSIVDCANTQVLKWLTAGGWGCATDETSAGGGITTIQENDVDAVTSATTIDFLGTDFVVGAVGAEGNVSIDYTNSGITRKAQAETVTGGWTFNTAATIFTTGITANGGISLGTQAVTGSTGNIDYTNFDVIGSSGNVDTAGTITAGSGNEVLTLSTGKIDADALTLIAAADAGTGTSSGSGLIARSDGIGLLQGCSDGQVLKWVESTDTWDCSADASGSGTSKFVVKGSNENVASGTTLQSDNDLTFAVGASETWVFDFHLRVTNLNSITPDWKAAILGAAGWTCAWTMYGIVGTTVDAKGNGTDCDNAPTAVADASIIADASIPLLIHLQGTLTTNSSGSVTLQWAANTSGSLTVMAGSYVIAQKVGGSDLAEIYYTRDDSLKAGDVVSLDSSLEAGVKKSSTPYDREAIGIIATKPGLLLGDESSDYEGRAVPVALSGRVPVSVSTENGPIRVGDLLTSSSVEGVAMRATKAGQIVGQAMTPYDGDTVGSVLAFIKTDYANGSRIADFVPALGESEQIAIDPSKAVMSYFLSEKESLQSAADVSEIVTDRVAAGLEIITPKVTTQELATDIIKSSLTNKLSIMLGADGEIVIGEEGKAATTSIDALGNATFAGIVTAKTIRAETIEGLEIYTDSVKSLEDKYATLETIANQDTTTEESQAAISATGSVFKNLTTNTLAVNLDASILGKLTAAGGLSITGDAEFHGKTLFQKLATFFGDAVFKGKVMFEETPTFSSNTAGFAVIAEGQNSVDIAFDESYAKQPIVSVSLTSNENPLFNGADKGLQNDLEALEKEFVDDYFDRDMKFIVTKKNEKGFTILLNKNAPHELTFSWVALAVNGAKTSYSKKVADTSSEVSLPEVTEEEIKEEVSQEEAPVVSPSTEIEVINESQEVDVTPDAVSVSPAVEESEPVSEAVSSEEAAITENEGELITANLGE